MDKNGQTVNSYTYTGREELPVKFTPGTLNPEAALFTSYLVNHSPSNSITMNYIGSNNGLRNGDSPLSIYNMFNNFGYNTPFYRNENHNTFRVTASFNTDIKKHAITFGGEFDQRTFSNYILQPSGLWTRMRQLTESPAHLQSLDLTNPILVPEFSGLIPYYYFDRAYNPELKTQFYERLLDKLGLPQNYTGFINTDELDPSTFSLDMFSAEDLLGNTASASSQLVQENIGFNYDGTRNTDKTDINDFLNKKDAQGRNLLPVGTFKPIYASVYLMDKFDFKDMKFNVGLRVDRYDANQPVLKDKYSLHELAKVGDLGSIENLPEGFSNNLPSNISKDAAIYVAQNPSGGKSPLAIKGFREGDRWFNAEGIEIADPQLIASSSGVPVPLLKDRANYEKSMSTGGFTDYAAAINFMPRVAFSFPISDVANFFAHYDILTQRPQTNVSALNPVDYYFLGTGSAAASIVNPALKPQQTIDYELGFSQILNERKSAALTITSFYRELRNLINQRTVVNAYPKTYVMFDNVDFGTVKGLSVVLDIRRTGGSRINFNYTLQFAEGSGSNINSGANLASTGQPNLRVLVPLDYDQRHNFVLSYDYRFGRKKDYKGPSFKTKANKTINVFEDVGFNLTFMLGSGTPYTSVGSAVPINGGSRGNIVGQINGSSKPWNFRSNLRIDKNIPLTWGKDKGEEKRANLNVYFQVLNLFNSQNVLTVYQFTGAPDDDGYLASTQAQAALAQTNSTAAFRDMYSIRANNPENYSLPRQMRIGLLFEF